MSSAIARRICCMSIAVGRRQAPRREQPRIDVDVDLTLLAAERSRGRQAGDGEPPHPNEVQPVIEDLLLGQGLARHGQLRHGQVRGVEANDVGACMPGGVMRRMLLDTDVI
jgi:hypothetical protein